MDALSFTEENYLKAIYSLQLKNDSRSASVNDIAELMNTKPATVTDMLKKLSDKQLIHYERYKKTQLSESGTQHALQVVRKHRLWEVFLHQKLQFAWDEVHEIAEQLEHIHSVKLIKKLDEYLGYPQFDPHGDPIPNEKGEINPASDIILSTAAVNTYWRIVAVKDTSTSFLQQLEKTGLGIGTKLFIKEVLPYDNSIIAVLNEKATLTLSEKVAGNLLVEKC